jgi:YfiH family protein
MTDLIKDNASHTIVSDIPGLGIGVIGRGGNDIDYSRDFFSVRTREKSLVAAAAGMPVNTVLFLNQVHGDAVLALDHPPGEDLAVYGDGDALVTPCPGMVLVIRTADCVPLFLFDTKKKVLAAVHSGWKGCSLGIAVRALNVMQKRYGCSVAGVRAFVLPCIGADSYEVQQDVAGLFPRDVSVIGGRMFLDLATNIICSLRDAGMDNAAIFNAGRCTFRDNGEFFSHRRGDPQRNLNYAFIA